MPAGRSLTGRVVATKPVDRQIRQRLGDMAMPLRAVLAGLAQGRADHGLQTRLVLDHSRRRGG
jgi:hypothetical protein